jgi:hypothetical protein
MAVNINVRYRFRTRTNSQWMSSSKLVRMENPHPSESMIRNKILSESSNLQDVEIIDFKVQ